MNIKDAINYCCEIAEDEQQCEDCRNQHLQLACWLEELVLYRKLLKESKRKPELDMNVEVNIFDKETIIEDCTIQILENTHTGKMSVGWWKNE